MPKMDGLTLLDAIRKDTEHAQLPVLMVTCEDSSETVKKIINASAVIRLLY